MHKIRVKIVNFYNNLLINWPKMQIITVQVAYFLKVLW